MTSLRRTLLAALIAQAAILACYYWAFFTEMFQYPPTLGQPLTPALGASLILLAALAVSARLWSGPGAERFAIASLAHVAALALFHCAIGLVTGRLVRPATAAFLAASLAAGAVIALRRRGRPQAPPNPEPPPCAWDAASAFVLATLMIPTVFPYIHYDTKYIWACRAFALDQTPSLGALARCVHSYAPTVGPAYPPVWSILLWLGIEDPVFQGRLLAWILLPLFALFFRARMARIDPSLAPPALLFLLVTVHVWNGAATYYADVPLMIFLVTGSLLVLGLPRRGAETTRSCDPSENALGCMGRGAETTRSCDRVAGTLCLCAAVLTRPDGIHYLAVVAVAAAWFGLRRKAPFPAGPFLAATAAAASWMLLRPASLHVAAQSPAPNELWRSAGATAGQAAWNLLLVFLYGSQGQWLSHRGYGVLFYLLAGLAVWRWRRAAPSGYDTRFFGLVSLGFLAAVLLCFAAMPFLNDMHVPGACRPGTNYLVSYMYCIRTGLGRMTVHLYPFLILWGVSAVQDVTEPSAKEI